jgi:GntR family transcriptional regulator
VTPEATHDVRVTGPIDPDAPEPLYEQLAGLLREDIRAGRIPPRRALPSNRALVQQHGVARGTAARAVQILIAEGWAFMVAGRGVYAVAGKDRPAS